MARMIGRIHYPNNECIKRCGFCFKWSPQSNRSKRGQKLLEVKQWRKDWEV